MGLLGMVESTFSKVNFSHGPQGCPGAALSLFLGKAFMAAVLRTREIELRSGRLDPSKPLPHMFDYFGIRLGLGAVAS